MKSRWMKSYSVSAKTVYCTIICESMYFPLITGKHQVIENALYYESQCSKTSISMAQCKTVLSPLHHQWKYCSLALSHQYIKLILRYFLCFIGEWTWSVQKPTICKTKSFSYRQKPDSIKMASYQYMKSNCWYKMVIRSSYLINGNSYTGKMTSLYWICLQIFIVFDDEILNKHIFLLGLKSMAV